MSDLRLNNGTIIGNYKTPYLVAELNTSHFGEIDQAKKLIHQAKVSGCDAIKLQSWTSESLYSGSFYRKIQYLKDSLTNFHFRKSKCLNFGNIQRK